MTASVSGDPGAAFRRLADAHRSQPELDLETRHLTRQSLAARHFVDAVSERVHYDHARGVWFIWSGHRWHLDRSGEVRRLWLDVLATRFRDALAMPDGDTRARTIAAVHTAGALDSAIAAGLRIAASMEPVALTGDEWDPDPWLLGCENGVVDLRSGVLRPGTPADMVTRSTRHHYNPEAQCPRWLRFLGEVFAGDKELIDWFHRLAGASFVGNSKEILAIHYGSGNNGKSVCFGTLGLVAGDYGVEIAIETLIGARRDAGAATSDLMRLCGARLAYSSEPDQSARLRGGALKRLASIDKMTGRELHQQQQEWAPTHTLHVATNHLPDADDNSEGFWRRIALVPWAVHFLKLGEPGDGPLEDGHLKAELAGEVGGILAWTVTGGVEYAALGLHPFPSVVARETASYREDEDALGEFVVARLEPSPAGRAVTSSELFAAYTAWADKAEVPKTERPTSKRFGRLFVERHRRLGFPVERGISAGRTAYRGLRIRDETGAATGVFGGSNAGTAGFSPTDGETDDCGKLATKPTKPTNGVGRRGDDGTDDAGEAALQ